MKNLALWIPFLALAILVAGCDRGTEPAPVPDPEVPPVKETKPAAQVDAAQPALTEAAIESLILDALSPGDDEAVAAAGDEKFSIHNLPEEQRKTLNDAMQKAVAKIDFKTLLSSLVSNLEINGLDLSNLPDNMSANTRILTPEEAKKMGINIGKLTGQASEGGEGTGTGLPGNVSIGDVRIIAIGDVNNPLTLTQPGSEDSDGENTPRTGITTEITNVTPIEVTEEDDPERTARFQSLLESGDSDALAGEIANLIQTGIDAATLQQAMGGEAPAAP